MIKYLKRFLCIFWYGNHQAKLEFGLNNEGQIRLVFRCARCGKIIIK
nr:MAG TPA: ubiquitin-binding zinc finger protein [Caudoviricetes sp.]